MNKQNEKKEKAKQVIFKSLHVLGYISTGILALLGIFAGVSSCNKKQDHNTEAINSLNKRPNYALREGSEEETTRNNYHLYSTYEQKYESQNLVEQTKNKDLGQLTNLFYGDSINAGVSYREQYTGRDYFQTGQNQTYEWYYLFGLYGTNSTFRLNNGNLSLSFHKYFYTEDGKNPTLNISWNIYYMVTPRNLKLKSGAYNSYNVEGWANTANTAFHYDRTHIIERYNAWKNQYNNNLLNLYYKGEKNWSFEVQESQQGTEIDEVIGLNLDLPSMSYNSSFEVMVFAKASVNLNYEMDVMIDLDLRSQGMMNYMNTPSTPALTANISYDVRGADYLPNDNVDVDDGFNLIGKAFSSLSYILNMNLFPGVSFGLLLSIPLIVTIIIVVFKLVRK